MPAPWPKIVPPARRGDGVLADLFRQGGVPPASRLRQGVVRIAFAVSLIRQLVEHPRVIPQALVAPAVREHPLTCVFLQRSHFLDQRLEQPMVQQLVISGKENTLNRLVN